MSVHKAPNGTWYVKYRVGNRQSTDRGHATRKAALDTEAKIRTGINTGKHVTASAGQLEVTGWVRDWYATRTDLAATTRHRIDGIIGTHIEPHFAGVQLRALRPTTVQAWVAKMTCDGSSPASVRKNVNVLSGALKAAVADRRLASNPCEGVKLPRVPASEMRALTHDQVADLAAAAGDWSTAVLVLAYTGVRFGELCALKVKDVDILRRQLSVRASLTEVNGHHVRSEPKSRKPRMVPMVRLVRDVLADHCAGKGSDELVFVGPRTGRPLRRGQVRRGWFDDAVVSAGLPAGFHPHELRHTAVSLALEAGMSLMQVSRIAGHDDPSITARVYAHWIDDGGVSLDRLDEAIEQARKSRPAQLVPAASRGIVLNMFSAGRSESSA